MPAEPFDDGTQWFEDGIHRLLGACAGLLSLFASAVYGIWRLVRRR